MQNSLHQINIRLGRSFVNRSFRYLSFDAIKTTAALVNTNNAGPNAPVVAPPEPTGKRNNSLMQLIAGQHENWISKIEVFVYTPPPQHHHHHHHHATLSTK